jgi:hypothetical protein
LAPQESIGPTHSDDINNDGQNDVEDHLNTQDENQSQSYKGHSNNSPDDLSILTPGKKLPKQLKWILVSENNEAGDGRASAPGIASRGLNGADGGNELVQQNSSGSPVISTP